MGVRRVNMSNAYASSLNFGRYGTWGHQSGLGSGSLDGYGTNALFTTAFYNYQTAIVISPDNAVAFVTEAYYVRKLDLITRRVTTMTPTASISSGIAILGKCAQCTVCAAGKIATGTCSFSRDVLCLDCPSGSYTSTPGSTVCLPCVNSLLNGYLSGPGTSATSCPTACVAGYFLSNGSCMQCSVGQYSTGGQTACSTCTNKPAGTYYSSASTARL